MQDKYTQLNKAKRLALACLIFAASVFVLTVILPKFYPNLQGVWWLGLIKMASEAALIGGLADWFAVTALFKPIPAKYPIPHTNIVASNKSVIANNLSLFVGAFFPLGIEVNQYSDPAKGAGRWLSQDRNATRLSRFLCDAFAGVLRVLDDKPVKAFIAKTAQKGINQLDLRQLMATSLTAVTKERQHQVVLDRVLVKLASLLAEPETQIYIADTLVVCQKLNTVVSKSWRSGLSEQGALIAVKAVSSILEDVYEDEHHPIRHAFDEQVHEFLYELQHSPLMEKKVNSYREKIIYDPALNEYVQQSWAKFHQWLLTSLEQQNGKAETKVSSLLNDLGTTLTQDSELAKAFNKHIGEAAKYMAPELAEFLTRHIRDTINSWDEREMAEQVELNIGRDLQKVRINGTIVAG